MQRRRRNSIMAGQIIDFNAPSLQGKLPKRPEDLPRGLITPPQAVRDLVAREKAKFPPGRVTAEVEEQWLNDWTIQYYFDYLGHEVHYRRTPQGPEVLAVGEDETFALEKSMPLEEQLKLATWLV
jgi:hypothetical protein